MMIWDTRIGLGLSTTTLCYFDFQISVRVLIMWIILRDIVWVFFYCICYRRLTLKNKLWILVDRNVGWWSILYWVRASRVKLCLMTFPRPHNLWKYILFYSHSLLCTSVWGTGWVQISVWLLVSFVTLNCTNTLYIYFLIYCFGNACKFIAVYNLGLFLLVINYYCIYD